LSKYAITCSHPSSGIGISNIASAINSTAVAEVNEVQE